MRCESAVTLDAPAQRVWEVFSDVERWPEWTESVTSVERLDAGPLRIGSRTRIKQPRLPVAVWEVTELVEGEYFTWVSTGPGVRTTGGHRVETTSAGTVVATSTVDQEGPLGPLFGRLLKKLTDRYLAIEGAGLKARSEAA